MAGATVVPIWVSTAQLRDSAPAVAAVISCSPRLAAVLPAPPQLAAHASDGDVGAAEAGTRMGADDTLRGIAAAQPTIDRILERNKPAPRWLARQRRAADLFPLPDSFSPRIA